MLTLKVSYLCFCVFLEMSPRNGTDVDAALAMKTFSNLGYTIRFTNDQTVREMTQLMLNGNGKFLIHSRLPL